MRAIAPIPLFLVVFRDAIFVRAWLSSLPSTTTTPRASSWRQQYPQFQQGKSRIVEPTVTYIPPLKLKTSSSSSSLFAGLSAALPRIHDSAFQELATKKFAVIPNFLPAEHCELLKEDIKKLRQQSKFKVARLGQDSTNQLNEETCFLGVDKLKVVEFLRHPEIFFTTH